MTSITEATPDFLELPQGQHSNGDTICRSGSRCAGKEKDKANKTAKESKLLIELYPLELKTFVIELKTL